MVIDFNALEESFGKNIFASVGREFTTCSHEAAHVCAFPGVYCQIDEKVLPGLSAYKIQGGMFLDD